MALRKKSRSLKRPPALSRGALVARLSQAEETLRAIRCGEVDAIVGDGPGAEKVFTLRGADHTSRVFVERMNEKAIELGLQHSALRRKRAMVIWDPEC